MRVWTRSTVTMALAAAMLAAAPQRAAAQTQDPAATAQPPAQPDQPSDRAMNPSEPDFTLIGLPTTLRIPKFGSSFRVTHRFTRSLGAGNFGDLLEDAFGLDGGAQIGLEYRFGIMSGTQLGFHRTSDKTIEFFLQHQILRQSEGRPVTLDVLGSIEGPDNFKDNDSYSPTLGAVISRALGRHGAVYFHPIWVNNSSVSPSELVDDNDTFLFGFGTRLRVRPTVYAVFEAAPRIGHTPDATYVSFAIEKRAGGHSFQFNFSNGFGTTFGQIARGGVSSEDWYLGFNISRKFF